MAKTYRNEADLIDGIKRYARVTGKRAKQKRLEKIDKRIRARANQIIEDRALALADQQTKVDAKPDVNWHETWRQKRWSFL
jgi:hypothetical protein